MIRVHIDRFLSVLAFVFLGCVLAVVAGATEPDVNSRDTLVYKDGDRVQGRLVDKTDKIIVFESDRFGVLRVLVGNAVVIKADPQAKPLTGVAAATPANQSAEQEKAAQKAEAERISVLELFRLSVLTAKLGDFFGPWHGHFAFSLEQLSNTADQVNTGVEMGLLRKWKSDEVTLKGRFDFNQTNKVTVTDLFKADGLWRHDFPKRYFTLYRPTLEWNRASINAGLPNDYVQLQQEIGAGVALLAKPRTKLRVGVSENLFDIWTTAPIESHSSRTVESLFLETELKLPWRMNLSQRGVYYYSVASGENGWEDRIELSKKFTETFSTSLRHEIRRFNPDGKTQDYSRLRLLFGIDF